MHDHRQVRGLLDGRHAEAADFFGELGQRLRDAVLDLDLGFVDVGAQFEGHCQRDHTVACGLRKHIERILNTVDGLLQRRGDRLGDGFRVRAWIGRAHDDGGWNDLRVFADRQPEHREQTNDEDHGREHARENRAPDEEVGEVHSVMGSSRVGQTVFENSKFQVPNSKEIPRTKLPNDPREVGLFEISHWAFLRSCALWIWSFFIPGFSCCGCFALLQRLATLGPSFAATASCGATGMPGRTRCRPLTTIISSGSNPDRTTRLPSMTGPSVTDRYATVLVGVSVRTNFCAWSVPTARSSPIKTLSLCLL